MRCVIVASTSCFSQPRHHCSYYLFKLYIKTCNEIELRFVSSSKILSQSCFNTITQCESLSQLIAELQTSACDSKEEAVRLQQAMEKRLRETSDRWDEERRRMSADADQAVKVSVKRNSRRTDSHFGCNESVRASGSRAHQQPRVSMEPSTCTEKFLTSALMGPRHMHNSVYITPRQVT